MELPGKSANSTSTFSWEPPRMYVCVPGQKEITRKTKGEMRIRVRQNRECSF